MGTKAAVRVPLLLGLLRLLLVLEQHITAFKGFMVKLYCFSFFSGDVPSLLPPGSLSLGLVKS